MKNPLNIYTLAGKPIPQKTYGIWDGKEPKTVQETIKIEDMENEQLKAILMHINPNQKTITRFRRV